MKSLLIAAGATVAYGLYWYISHLRHNIAEAKRSGLPYIVARKCSLASQPPELTPGSLLADMAALADNPQAVHPRDPALPRGLVGSMA